MDQLAAYVEAATEVPMESSLDSAHLESESLQNIQIQTDMDQSSPDPRIQETEVKAAMEMEVADMMKEDFGLAGLMQSKGEKKEMDEALWRLGNRSSDCPMLVRVWQVSVLDGEVKRKHVAAGLLKEFVLISTPLASLFSLQGKCDELSEGGNDGRNVEELVQSHYLPLKRLLVQFSKPMMKMKHMVVPVDSCMVFKGGGMTRVTHMQVQHGEVIGGNLGKQFDLDKGRLQGVTRWLGADECDGVFKLVDDAAIQTLCGLGEPKKEPNASSSPPLIFASKNVLHHESKELIISSSPTSLMHFVQMHLNLLKMLKELPKALIIRLKALKD